MDQIIDKRTVAIPGPMGDVTPAALAAKTDAQAARDQAVAAKTAAATSATQAAASATQAAAAPASDANVAARVTSGSLTRAAIDATTAGLATDSKTALYRALHPKVPQPQALFVGDSYTVGARATATANRWTSRLCAAQGWTERNYGVNGSGYQTGGDDGRKFLQQVQKAVSDGVKPDIVFVSGGRNDGGNAIDADAVFSLIRSSWPGAEVYALPALWDSIAVPDTLLQKAHDVAVAARGAGAHVIWHAWEWLYGQPDLIYTLPGGGKDLHPNDAGYAELARRVASALRGDSTALTRFPAPVSGYSGSSAGSFSTEIHDGVVYLVGTMGSDGNIFQGWTFAQLPAPCAPGRTKYIPGFTAGGGVSILIEVAPDGKCKVNNIYGSAGVGIGVLQASWPVGR